MYVDILILDFSLPEINTSCVLRQCAMRDGQVYCGKLLWKVLKKSNNLLRIIFVSQCDRQNNVVVLVMVLKENVSSY